MKPFVIILRRRWVVIATATIGLIAAAIVAVVTRLPITSDRLRAKVVSTLEERLGWQPWPTTTLIAGMTRDLWTPFGLHLVARKR